MSDYGTHIMDGFFDTAQAGGPIKGSGPNFAEAMAKFSERQKQKGLPGVWRSCNKTSWKKKNGKFVDRDWDIINI
jgi:hypothetical protein